MPSPTPATRNHAVLIFDGDCGFCTSSVRWLKRTIPVMPESIPYQWAPLDGLGLTQSEAKERVWLVTSDGTGFNKSTAGGADLLHQYGGYLAFSAILRHQPHLGWRFLGILIDTPPFSLIAGIGYSLVAAFRHSLPGGTPACRMQPPA